MDDAAHNLFWLRNIIGEALGALASLLNQITEPPLFHKGFGRLAMPHDEMTQCEQKNRHARPRAQCIAFSNDRTSLGNALSLAPAASANPRSNDRRVPADPSPILLTIPRSRLAEIAT